MVAKTSSYTKNDLSGRVQVGYLWREVVVKEFFLNYCSDGFCALRVFCSPLNQICISGIVLKQLLEKVFDFQGLIANVGA